MFSVYERETRLTAALYNPDDRLGVVTDGHTDRRSAVEALMVFNRLG